MPRKKVQRRKSAPTTTVTFFGAGGRRRLRRRSEGRTQRPRPRSRRSRSGWSPPPARGPAPPSVPSSLRQARCASYRFAPCRCRPSTPPSGAALLQRSKSGSSAGTGQPIRECAKTLGKPPDFQPTQARGLDADRIDIFVPSVAAANSLVESRPGRSTCTSEKIPRLRLDETGANGTRARPGTIQERHFC